MSFKKLILFFILSFCFFNTLKADSIDFTKPVLSVSVVSPESIIQSKYHHDINQFLIEIKQDYLGRRLLEKVLLKDIDRLFLLGYFDQIYAQTVPLKNGVELQFVVSINPILSSVLFKGISVFSESFLLNSLYHKPGVIFNSKFFKSDLERIKSIYINEGIDLFQIEESFLDEKNNLVFKFNEGTIRSIRWEGLTTIEPFILNRRLRSQPFSVLNSDYLRKDRELLLQLGYFSDVSAPRLEETLDKTAVDIVFEVQETESNRVGLGLEVEQREGDVVGFFRGDLNHLLLPSDLLSGKTQLGWSDGQIDVRTYSIQYYQPWFLNLVPLSFQTNAWWITQTERISNDLNTNFENTRIGADISFGLPLLYEELVLSSRLLVEHVSPNAQSLDLGLEQYQVQSISLQIKYSNLEDRFNPKGGYNWSAEATRGVDWEIFDNSLVFSRYRFDGAAFLGLNDDSVLGMHVGLGYFTTEEDIVTFEREKFEIGGSQTLRGFQETRAFIGDRKLLINLEYRWDHSDAVQWVLFYDIGKTFDGELDLTFDSFHQGRGVGLRFFTPLGPIRFDLAQGVESGSNESDIVLHFSLGQLF